MGSADASVPFESSDSDRLQGESLGEILAASLPAPSISTMAAHAADSQGAQAAKALLYSDDGEAEWVARIVSEVTRLPVVPPWYCIRIFSASMNRVGALVLHDLSQGGDAEIVVFAQPGLVTRSSIRAGLRWAFWQFDRRRLTLRIRSSDEVSRGYAKRLGFRPEGVQRAWFEDGEDAHLWGMQRAECGWIYGGSA